MQEYIKTFDAKLVAQGFNYTSGANTQWETVKGLRELIKTHLDSNFNI